MFCLFFEQFLAFYLFSTNADPWPQLACQRRPKTPLSLVIPKFSPFQLQYFLDRVVPLCYSFLRRFPLCFELRSGNRFPSFRFANPPDDIFRIDPHHHSRCFYAPASPTRPQIRTSSSTSLPDPLSEQGIEYCAFPFLRYLVPS